MEFTYFGNTCVLITTKQLRVLVDPLGKMPKAKSDVILYSKQGDTGFDRSDGFTVDSSGEYEIKTVSIHGIPAQSFPDKPKDPKRSVMYVVEYRGVRALFTGNISPNIGDKQLDEIGAVDVLVVPVGGREFSMDGNAASNIVGRFEPSFVIPVHYDDGKTKYEKPQDKVQVFLKEMGSEDTSPVAKLKVTDKDIQEGTSVVVLEHQG